MFKHLVLQSTNSGDEKLTSNEQLLLIKPLKTLNMLTCFNTAKLRVMGGQWISISAFEWVGFHCEIGSTQLLHASTTLHNFVISSIHCFYILVLSVLKTRKELFAPSWYSVSRHTTVSARSNWVSADLAGQIVECSFSIIQAWRLAIGSSECRGIARRL